MTEVFSYLPIAVLFSLVFVPALLAALANRSVAALEERARKKALDPKSR